MVGVLAGVVAFLSFVPYIRHILTGTVRPERASWLIWAVLTSIAFFSNLAAGARAALWLPALASLGVLVVFALSIRFGMGGLAGRDTVALTMAAAGLAAWWVTKDPAYALLCTIAVDGIAAALTTWKSFEHPHTETYSVYVLLSLAGLLSAISVGRVDTMVVIYPVYVCLSSSGIVAALFLGRVVRGPAAEPGLVRTGRVAAPNPVPVRSS